LRNSAADGRDTVRHFVSARNANAVDPLARPALDRDDGGSATAYKKKALHTCARAHSTDKFRAHIFCFS
jgi:hypothetical protein